MTTVAYFECTSCGQFCDPKSMVDGRCEDCKACPWCKKSFKSGANLEKHKGICRRKPVKAQEKYGWIYILKQRSAIEGGHSVYKVGRVGSRNPLDRLAEYEKGSRLICCWLVPVDMVKEAEKDILRIFRKKFMPMESYGNEAFEGDLKEMIMLINEFLLEGCIDLARSEVRSMDLGE